MKRSWLCVSHAAEEEAGMMGDHVWFQLIENNNYYIDQVCRESAGTNLSVQSDWSCENQLQKFSW